MLREPLLGTVLAALMLGLLVPTRFAGQRGSFAPMSRNVHSIARRAFPGLPHGWMAHLDRREEQDGRSVADLVVEGDSTTLHVMAGPAAALWHRSHDAVGRYTVSGRFTLSAGRAPSGSAGPFIGGTHLGKSDSNYLYCAVFGNGTYTVKHRFGSELHSLVERQASGAIHHVDGTGRATNDIAWVVDEARVSCVVNGTAVVTYPRALLVGPGKLESTDGIAGVHVDRATDVSITEFGLPG